MQGNEDDDLYFTDNYQYLPAPTFCIESENFDAHHVNPNRGSKYFALLPTSTTGKDFYPIKFQIDTAATCNTISEKTVARLFSDLKLTKSPFLLMPYGDSKPIKPLGQISLLCERRDKYHALTFQVLPEHMGQKPALLSGKDCEKMGLIKIHADEVYSLQSRDPGDSPGYQAKSRYDNKPIPLEHTQFPPKRPLHKNDITTPFFKQLLWYWLPTASSILQNETRSKPDSDANTQSPSQ